MLIPDIGWHIPITGNKYSRRVVKTFYIENLSKVAKLLLCELALSVFCTAKVFQLIIPGIGSAKIAK